MSRANLALTMWVLFVIGVFISPLSEWWAVVNLLLLLVSVIYHLQAIYPFSFLHKVELVRTKKRDQVIKVLTCNVRQKNKNYKRLIALIQEVNPDLVLLTEVDQPWVDAVMQVKSHYPHRILHPQENTYGMALFSKYPLHYSEVRFLVEKDVPSIHTQVDFKGKYIQFFGLHPRPPAYSNEVRNKNLELMKVAALIDYKTLPAIVGGDLNDVGWSNITKKFKSTSGLLDPRVGRGLFCTYNALIPVFRIPVDHFFVSPHFKLLTIKRLKKVGSDHFPILLELNLES